MKTLVLISGWARNAKTYNQLIETCPNGWKVIVIPYHQIFPSRKDENIEENLVKVLHKEELDNIYLAGVSLGGEPCIKFANHYPEKVRALFLIDSCGVRSFFPGLQIIKSLFTMQTVRGVHRLKNDPSGAKDVFRRPLFYFKIIRHFLSLNLENQIKSLTIPTIILWGEKDNLIKLEQGTKIHKLIPHSKLIILKEMDHSWISYNPKLFWENIEG